MAVIEADLLERLQLRRTDQLVRARSVLSYDAIRISEGLIPYFAALIVERVAMREKLVGNEIGRVALADAIQLVEKLYLGHRLQLEDTIRIAQVEQLQTVWQIVEKLGIADRLNGKGTYGATLREALRLTASLTQFYGVDAADGFQITDELVGIGLAIAGLTDAVGVQDQMQPALLMNVVARDGVQLDDLDAIRMLFAPTVVEGIEIKAGYLGPDGSFTTWAMNTRTGAVTEYADFAFNSFASIGGSYFGASADGLYELLGDDDDGDDIIARIRGGFLQFGGTKLSRLKEAYLATRGGGQFVLRIVTGDDERYDYHVDARSMRSTKVHMGKGQRARYFAYELTSVGQDFDLDTLEFVPLVVQRRV